MLYKNQNTSELIHQSITFGEESTYMNFVEIFIKELQAEWRNKKFLSDIPVMTTCMKIEDWLYNKAINDFKPVPGDMLWMKTECINWYVDSCINMIRHLKEWNCDWKKTFKLDIRVICIRLLSPINNHEYVARNKKIETMMNKPNMNKIGSLTGTSKKNTIALRKKGKKGATKKSGNVFGDVTIDTNIPSNYTVNMSNVVTMDSNEDLNMDVGIGIELDGEDNLDMEDMTDFGFDIDEPLPTGDSPTLELEVDVGQDLNDETMDMKDLNDHNNENSHGWMEGDEEDVFGMNVAMEPEERTEGVVHLTVDDEQTNNSDNFHSLMKQAQSLSQIYSSENNLDSLSSTHTNTDGNHMEGDDGMDVGVDYNSGHQQG